MTWTPLSRSKGQKVKGQLAGDGDILWRSPAQLVLNAVCGLALPVRQSLRYWLISLTSKFGLIPWHMVERSNSAGLHLGAGGFNTGAVQGSVAPLDMATRLSKRHVRLHGLTLTPS